MAETKKNKPSKPEPAGPPAVTCPECDKKFKPKTDVRGKKIKCPFCKEPFLVPGQPDAKEEPAVDEAEAAAVFSAGEPGPKANDDSEYDADPNPYGVKNVELVPRCPNCTEEMGEHDIICKACGYNTLTREWGKTVKTIGLTFDQHFLYLLPALGSAAFIVFSMVFIIYYCTVYPFTVADIGGWWGWLLSLADHESLRMWTAVAFLLFTWTAGMFCFKKFIEKPKPDEVHID